MQRRYADMAQDYAQLLAMQEKSWEINFPGELFVESLFRDSLMRGMAAHDVFVYFKGGAMVGWLWMDWRMGSRRAHIRHIQVAEGCWGQGIGRRILLDATEMSRARHRTLLTLNVTKANERAMRLYTSLGFQVRRDMGPRQQMILDLSNDVTIKELEPA